MAGLVGAGTPEVQLWRQQARACWGLPAHPGWGLLHIAVEDFEAALPPGSGASTLLPAELAVPCRQEVMARLANLPPPDQLLAQAPQPPAAGGIGAPGAGAGSAAGGMGGPAGGMGGAAGPAPSAAVTTAPAEQQPPPSPAELAMQGQAPAPAGPESQAGGAAAAAAAGGGLAAAGGQAMDQAPLASPYETAMRLPSLPLLGDMFPSLPKASSLYIVPAAGVDFKASAFE